MKMRFRHSLKYKFTDKILVNIFDRAQTDNIMLGETVWYRRYISSVGFHTRII